jgi:hypothetical protein
MVVGGKSMAFLLASIRHTQLNNTFKLLCYQNSYTLYWGEGWRVKDVKAIVNIGWKHKNVWKGYSDIYKLTLSYFQIMHTQQCQLLNNNVKQYGNVPTSLLHPHSKIGCKMWMVMCHKTDCWKLRRNMRVRWKFGLQFYMKMEH